MGMGALLGEPLRVVPTIAIEARHHIGETEREIWIRRLEHDIRFGDTQVAVIAGAAADAAAAWFSAELERENSPLVCERPNWQSAYDARKAIRSIPSHHFPGAMPDDVVNDRLIIAEALSAGAEMLITENRASISHAGLNEWLVRSRRRNSDFICDTARAIDHLLPDRRNERCHFIVSAMTLSDLPRSDVQQRESCLRFASNLSNAFGLAATSVFDYEQSGHGAESRRRAAAVIGKSPWREARECEERRLDAVRRAAAEQGWQRE